MLEAEKMPITKTQNGTRNGTWKMEQKHGIENGMEHGMEIRCVPIILATEIWNRPMEQGTRIGNTISSNYTCTQIWNRPME